MSAFEGDSHVEWFEGNFGDYEEDKKRRLGIDLTIPKRIQYKKSAGDFGLERFTLTLKHTVIAGLDPAIHRLAKVDGCAGQARA